MPKLVVPKILKAKKTTWVTEGLDPMEVKYTVDTTRISTSLIQKRKSLNMSQQSFADYLGVTRYAVSCWENAHYNFSLKQLYSICKTLHWEPQVIINTKPMDLT